MYPLGNTDWTRLLGFEELTVAPRKQMPIAIRRDLDRRVPYADLHHLERQLQTAVDAAVDAPRDVEVP
jgi:hypothetical protein